MLERLYRTIQPLPTAEGPAGWPFGQPLHASDVYNMILAEPGVSYVDRVRLRVPSAPDRDVRALAADSFQPGRWYGGSGGRLYQTVNDSGGWELLREIEGESVAGIFPHPERSGVLALLTTRVSEGADPFAAEPDGVEWGLYVSRDCGLGWDFLARFQFRVRDLAWHQRDGVPLVFAATDRGLYEVLDAPRSAPVPVLVDPDRLELGFWSVVVSTGVRGQTSVAVAAQDEGGVYLSMEEGKRGSFQSIGLAGEDVRSLAVERIGPSSYLWAALFTLGDRPGKGCYRWELRLSAESPEGWRLFGEGWGGGSCFRLAFAGGSVFAATHHGGVLQLDQDRPDPCWAIPAIDCGLALRDVGRFHPVYSVATRSSPDAWTLLAGGPTGVARRASGADRYAPSSATEFRDRLTLPPTWLFCSGEHEIRVVRAHEAERD